MGCYVFWLFFKIGLYEAISFGRFRRELTIDAAEHFSVLKNYQKKAPALFQVYTKNRHSIPRNGDFVFTVIFRSCQPINSSQIKNLITKKTERSSYIGLRHTIDIHILN